MSPLPKQSGDTPLELAAFGGYLDTLRVLLSAGADGGIANRQGNTPLHLVLRFPECVKLVLETAGKATIARANSEGDTPLVRPTAQRRCSALSSVIGMFSRGESCLTSSRNTPRIRAQHLAAFYGAAESVRLLLAHGAVADVRNAEEETPAHLAASHAHTGCLRLLLGAGANAHARNKARSVGPAARSV